MNMAKKKEIHYIKKTMRMHLPRTTVCSVEENSYTVMAPKTSPDDWKWRLPASGLFFQEILYWKELWILIPILLSSEVERNKYRRKVGASLPRICAIQRRQKDLASWSPWSEWSQVKALLWWEKDVLLKMLLMIHILELN